MDDRVLWLDEICAVLSDALRQTNATLHEISWPADDTRQTALSYRMAEDAPNSWRAIPHSALYRHYRYRVSGIAFSFPCCVSTRLLGGSRQTVLRLCLPAWWRRLGQRPLCRRIEIDVSPHGTNLRFLPGDLVQLPRKGMDWIVLLTPKQQAMLAQPESTGSGITATAEDDRAESAAKRKEAIGISGLVRRWKALWRRHRGERRAD